MAAREVILEVLYDLPKVGLMRIHDTPQSVGAKTERYYVARTGKGGDARCLERSDSRTFVAERQLSLSMVGCKGDYVPSHRNA